MTTVPPLYGPGVEQAPLIVESGGQLGRLMRGQGWPSGLEACLLDWLTIEQPLSITELCYVAEVIPWYTEQETLVAINWLTLHRLVARVSDTAYGMGQQVMITNNGLAVTAIRRRFQDSRFL